MKGVIHTLSPGVPLLDVTHEVEPQDVMGAAWILRQTVPFCPPGTVHLVVVDPGVGTSRRAVACSIGGHVFVGADNGLFSLLLGDDAPEPDRLVVLDRPEAWRTRMPRTTFHGRDIFAPVAARLAAGRELEDVGSPAPVDSLIRLHWVRPRADEQGVQGWIVHIDRYGNAITNIPAELVNRYQNGRSVRCYAGHTIIEGVAHTYASVETGEPLVVPGSSGHLEISINGGNAASMLSLVRGASVNFVFGERRQNTA